jgi:hypothetical protein
MRTSADKIAQQRSRALAAVALSLVPGSPAFADFSSTRFESVYVRTDVAVRTIAENDLLTPVPGMSIAGFTVEPEDSDVFTVLYTAQSELRNGSSSSPTLDSDDVLELQMQAVKNNGAIIIFSPSGPAALKNNNGPEGQALSWSARLIEGVYTFRLMARVRDAVPLSDVTGVLTNAMMTINRYD